MFYIPIERNEHQHTAAIGPSVQSWGMDQSPSRISASAAKRDRSRDLVSEMIKTDFLATHELMKSNSRLSCCGLLWLVFDIPL